MYLKRIISLFGATVLSFNVHAQNKVIDSLKQLYNASPQSKDGAFYAYSLAKAYDHLTMFDSALYYVNQGINTANNLKPGKTLVALYNTLGNIHNAKSEYKSAEKAYLQGLKITEAINDSANMAKLLNNLGTLEERTANYSEAYKYFNQALALFTTTHQQKGISDSYSNIALIYHDQGNNAKAIEYNLKALEIVQKMNEPYSTGNILNNIGNVYHDANDDKLAVDYYTKALEKYRLAKSKLGEGQICQNLGLVYESRKAYDTALAYLKKGLSIQEELGERRNMADCFNDIGTIYLAMKNPSASLENNQHAYDIYKAIGDKEGMAESMDDLARAYFALNKFSDAEKIEKEALEITKRINSPSTESLIHEMLSEIYEKTKQTGEAYNHYKDYVRLRDSLNGEESTKQLVKAQLAHQFEQDQQAAAMKEEKRIAIEHETERRQKAILYFVIGILILALIFGGIMVNRFLLIRKQKHTIEAQKSEVENKNKIIEEKNKDITDSINYARNIQRALMPNEQEVRQMFPESFVLYMPKDIVSGDFYWMAEKDGKALLLAADCTGHGVPGALMSMIGVSLFNETVEKKDIVQPGQILNEVRSGIINTFKQTGNTQHKDGMDAALCCIDLKTLKAEFAGAYNPMWILTKSGETREITPDKQPVGIQEGQKPTFTTQSLQLEKGDTLYLFSDGYADQFGGPNGKKFKYKQLQQLIVDNAQLTMQEQKSVLEKKFLEWKGSLDQVDDVLIIGVRV